MWWRVVISFLVLKSSVFFGQNLDESYRLANFYYLQGEYNEAEEMYQRVTYFDTSFIYLDSYQKLAEIKFVQKDYAQSRSYYKLHTNWIDTDSIRVFNAFKVTTGYFMEDLYGEAIVELLLIKHLMATYGLEDKWRLHLGVAYFQNGNYDKSKELFSGMLAPESQDQLDKIFRKNNRLEKKFNRYKVQIMSIILPGAGQAYTGNIGAGVNSAVLVAGFVYLFTRVVGVLSVTDAVLAVYPWMARYYIGGVKKAGNFADERVLIKRSQYYQRILLLVGRAN